ncbi:MAG: hypothetical protein J6B91_09275 [Prevotella sp.]|nr:hypothetical protein [Prevotella sp.]
MEPTMKSVMNLIFAKIVPKPCGTGCTKLPQKGKTMYKHPFANDPFRAVYTVFKTLWPEKDCACFWNSNIEDDDGETVYGVTVFSDGALMPEVHINPCLKVSDAVEILAHELAHVAVLHIDDGHGAEWEKAFDAIHREYERFYCGGKHDV